MIPTLADEIIPIIAMGVGGTIAVVAIIAGSVRHLYVSRAREATKREIAAYVAEGSMSADEGERLLKSEPPRKRC